MDRTLANVVAIGRVQAGVQPGLKSREAGQADSANPFAALLASAPSADTQGQAAAQPTGSGTVAQPGASRELPRPLQLLKDIADALEAALASGEELPRFDALPAEIQALLADFAALPQEALSALGNLIGPERVAALSDLAESLQQNGPVIDGPEGQAPAADPVAGPRPLSGNAASPDAASPGAVPAPAAQVSGALEPAIPATPPVPAGPAVAPSLPNDVASVAGEAPSGAVPAPAASASAQQVAAEPAIPATPAQPAAASARETAANTSASANTGGGSTQGAAPASPAQQPAAPTATPVQQSADVAAPAGQADTAARPLQNATRPAPESDSPATARTFLQDFAQGTQPAEGSRPDASPRPNATNALAQAIREATASAGASAARSGAPTADPASGLTPAQGADAILLGADRPGQMMAGQAAGRSVTVSAYGASLPVNQIAIAVSSQARTGTRHFEIRLDPPEMGRIDVRLEMARDGTMNAQLTVDRPETFDALNRDARHLERMLQQSGMKIDGGNIQFSLRDGGGSGQGAHEGDRGTAQAGATLPSGEDEAAAAPAYARISPSALVDIQV
ncbi:MAG: flagellar hook-length control protein FliK [Rhodobacteraceae bacterium]|nr:flagellar hook-length control protein FliK [Paracoccaceae bacterium]